jgi:CubicO group peptidase (beta-lactamase class C family)
MKFTPLARRHLRTFLFCLLPLAACLAPAAAEDLASKVDALFREWNKPDTPGASVAVIQHGKIVYEHGFGCANLEYDVPIKPDTIFHVASVSKQFTAMAVLLLQRDGKLSIDDDVHQYLPELPDYGQKITLRHLLNHTSGVRDQWATLGLAGWDLKDVITQDQILRLLFRQKELNFTPGERMLYSNGGFTLLAEIVHRVSQQPFPDFCRERIFQPLGMAHTHFHLRLEEIVPNRAYSYTKGRSSGFTIAPLNYANVGATSLFTTAGDLARWLDNFRDPKVGTVKEIAMMATPGVLNSGKSTDYGLGISVDKYRGLPSLSHNGADAGYRSAVLWFPGKELGIAIASNLDRVNPARLAEKVADLYLANDFPAPAKNEPAKLERKEIKLAAETLDKFTGSYAFDAAPDFVLTYTREGDRMFAQATGQDRFEIFPESKDTFFYKVVDAQVTFVTAPDGSVNHIVHHQNGRNQAGTRTKADAPPSTVGLAQFTGVFWSEELETRYTFLLKDGQLTGQHLRHGDFTLTPVSGNRFRTPLWFMPSVEFLTDPAGRVTGAKLGGGRVVGVRFTRQSGATDTTAKP